MKPTSGDWLIRESVYGPDIVSHGRKISYDIGSPVRCGCERSTDDGGAGRGGHVWRQGFRSLGSGGERDRLTNIRRGIIVTTVNRDYF